MNGNARYELAKTMIADRQREASHSATVAQASAARRASATDVTDVTDVTDRAGTSFAARFGRPLARRARVLLRPRTA
jgi:hypothetical protein